MFFLKPLIIVFFCSRGFCKLTCRLFGDAERVDPFDLRCNDMVVLNSSTTLIARMARFFPTVWGPATGGFFLKLSQRINGTIAYLPTCW